MRFPLIAIERNISVEQNCMVKGTKFYDTKLMKIFLAEAFVCCLHIPPGVEYVWRGIEFHSMANSNSTCVDPAFFENGFCYVHVVRNLDQFCECCTDMSLMI